MPPGHPLPRNIKAFKTAAAFETWLRAKPCAPESEIWLRVYKKGSGEAEHQHREALDVALCWGWIDAIRKSLDAESYLPALHAAAKQAASGAQVNRDHVARLTAAGRMQPSRPARQVDAAKADGRWEAAYAPIRGMTEASLPDDLRSAIDASPRARKTFDTLGDV
jgi:uncharacterized protein YdeI (YjbR/CyaY-like superfamily)